MKRNWQFVLGMMFANDVILIRCPLWLGVWLLGLGQGGDSEFPVCMMGIILLASQCACKDQVHL